MKSSVDSISYFNLSIILQFVIQKRTSKNESGETLLERPHMYDQSDVSDLLIHQIQFANMILISKVDLVSADYIEALKDLLTKCPLPKFVIFYDDAQLVK